MMPPGKKETLLAYLGSGIAMLHLDARRTGVAVPEQHTGDPHLRLNLSYRYGIPDLIVDGEKVQATLSFRGRAFQCKLPWSAIFGITSQTTGEGQVWPEDLPGEVVSALSEHDETEGGEAGTEHSELLPPGAATTGPAGAKGKPVRKRREPARKRPALVAVESAPEVGAAPFVSERSGAPADQAEQAGNQRAPSQAPPQATPPAAPEAPEGSPRRGHLRLVR